jgi:Ras-related protein Rab-2A
MQAGQESFKAITRSYYKGSIAVFLIFDITNKNSFDSLHKWLFEIKNHSHDRVEIILLGNKVDIKSQ